MEIALVSGGKFCVHVRSKRSTLSSDPTIDITPIFTPSGFIPIPLAASFVEWRGSCVNTSLQLQICQNELIRSEGLDA